MAVRHKMPLLYIVLIIGAVAFLALPSQVAAEDEADDQRKFMHVFYCAGCDSSM